MSNIRFFTFNLCTQPATVITATSENAQFPASNIKDPRTTKVTRSETGTLSNDIVFDFITASEVDSILIAGNSVTGFTGITGDITIKANIIDGAWGTAPFTTTLTPSDTFNFGFKILSASETYRYWQVSFSNSSGYTELSKIFIGKSVQLADNNIDFGWGLTDRDTSKFRRNRYRQRFSDKINRQAVYDTLNFRLLTKDEHDTIVNMVDDVGETTPVWMIVDDSGIIVNDVERFSGYFYFRSMPKRSNAAFSLYNLSLSVEEST